MRFNKILLLYPNYPGSYYYGGKTITPPIGLGYIAENLKPYNIAYAIFDMGLGYEIHQLIKKIEDFKPDTVAFSIMTFRYKYLYSIIDRIKEYFPLIKIIVGGPHLTAWRRKVLEQNQNIDFGVSLEGELTMVELCQDKELDEIKGLIYRQDGKIFQNEDRNLIEDLDSIPFPKYERFELDKYANIIEICSSRGCPYNCIFCQSKSMLGRKWRACSAKNVAEEIEYWYKKGYRRFSFVDDNFTLDKIRVYSLCDELKSRDLKNLWIGAGGVRADKVDKELLIKMRQVGFKYLAFGVEAGNNRILKYLKKNVTIEQIEETVRNAIDLDFDVKLYFLVGSPYETLRDVQDSIDFALRYPIVDVNFSSLMPIPDTELIAWVRANGRLLREPEDYLNEFAEFERVPLFDAPGMNLNQRVQALQITEKVREKISHRIRGRELQKRLSHLRVVGLVLAKIYNIDFIFTLMQSSLMRRWKRWFRIHMILPIR